MFSDGLVNSKGNGWQQASTKHLTQVWDGAGGGG